MSKGPPTKEGGRSHQDPKQKLTVKTKRPRIARTGRKRVGQKTLKYQTRGENRKRKSVLEKEGKGRDKKKVNRKAKAKTRGK